VARQEPRHAATRSSSRAKIAGPGRREWIRGGENHVTKRTVPWAIDDSLKRLQTDHIDLYQIHWTERYVPAFGAWQYDPSKEREATPIARADRGDELGDPRWEDSRVRLSNETAWGCASSCASRASTPASARIGAERLQPRQPDVRRRPGGGKPAPERSAAGLLAARDGAAQCKYSRHRLAAGCAPQKFPDFGERYKRPRVLAAAEEYRRVADKHGLPLPGVALAFARSRFFTASTIIGATTIAQLDDLAPWFEATLQPEVLADLEAVNGATPSPARSKRWRSGSKAGSSRTGTDASTLLAARRRARARFPRRPVCPDRARYRR
jgi:aryl-alcohol dehydrogenase (NADP+)